MSDPTIRMLQQAHGGFTILEDGMLAGMPEVHILPPDGVYVVRKVYTADHRYVGMEYLQAHPKDRTTTWHYVDKDEDDSTYRECIPLVGLGGPWMDYDLPLEEWTDAGIAGLLEKDKAGELPAHYQRLADEAKATNWVPGKNGDRTQP